MLRIAVHNLPSNVVSWELREFFNAIAPLYTFNLQRGRDGEDTFALLTFNNDEDARRVLRSCTNCTWAGIKLRVSIWEKNIRGPINHDDYWGQSFNSQSQSQGWNGSQSNVYRSPWNNGNEPFPVRQTQPVRDKSDLMLRNLDEEWRDINERISFLQNSMRMTANNINNLSLETPPLKRQKVFNDDFRGPSTSFGRNPIRNFPNQAPGKFNLHGIKKGPKIKPVKRLTNTVVKTISKNFQTIPEAFSSFDKNLVHKMVMCYGNLYGLNSMNSIKQLAQKNVLTPEMVNYVSNGKIEVDIEGKIIKDGTIKGKSKTAVISTIEISPESPNIGKISANFFNNSLKNVAYNCPEMSKKQKKKVFKSLKLFNKKCRKVFKDHLQDHRFVDALMTEGPEDLKADLLQGWVPPKEPNEFDKLPKCPEPPEHYFSIEKYYREMREFFAKFSASDYRSFNYFKRIFSCSPPISHNLSKDIIFCVKVLGIYALKDKKFVLKALAKDNTPLIIINTEPTLLLGFITEEEQTRVLKRNGERINHVKLYLKSFSPKAPKDNSTYEQMNPQKQLKLKRLFRNIVKVFALHINNIPSLTNSDPKWKDIPDNDEFGIFEEDDMFNNQIDDYDFANEDGDGEGETDVQPAVTVDISKDQNKIENYVSVDKTETESVTEAAAEKSQTSPVIAENGSHNEETTEGIPAAGNTAMVSLEIKTDNVSAEVAKTDN